MKKFRIVAGTPEGVGRTRYYVQKRERFLFIPYWTDVRDYGSDPVVGHAVYFYNLSDAKQFIKNYREAKSEIVYEE